MRDNVSDLLYAEKRAGYFANARRELIEPLAHDAHSVVLELGCGAGATGALALSEARCGSWVGVEKFPTRLARPSAR
jgi:tRNA G46 methylase TrmB